MKKYISISILIILAVGLFLILKNKKEPNVSKDSLVCYSFTSGEDLYSLNLNIKKENVEGELNFLPKEKDSKTGNFSGLISAFDPNTSARIIAAWWNSRSEGIEVREQLAILLTEETASVGFGEMLEIENGDYVYKDPAQVSYSLTLNKVDCI